MQQTLGFLALGEQKTIDAHRVLYSAAATLFAATGEGTAVQLYLTKYHLSLETDGAVLQKLAVHDIDAVTVSETSTELVLHMFDAEDERLACADRSMLLQLIMYLIAHVGANPADSPVVVSFYFVGDASLDLYVTSEEDLEDGHTIRPDDEHKTDMTYRALVDFYAAREVAPHAETRLVRASRSSSAKRLGIDDFKLLKVLGKGAHGKVLLAERTTTAGGRFALKVLRKQHILENKQLEHTRAEKDILCYVSHPFLIASDYSFQSEHKLYFAMEFMPGGELFQHLRKLKQFSELQAKHIAACIVLALGHLHDSGYIYRDLKPENVLMDQAGYVKLTDFGLAKNIGVRDLAKTFCGTPEYLAPEVICDKGCNRTADWWSLGVLVYEMIFGIPPFYSTNAQTMYKNTVVSPLKFKRHTSVSDECKDFIAGLLMKKPKQRLGAAADALEVRCHFWFKDINWTKLVNRQLDMPYRPLDAGANWEQNFEPSFIKQKAFDSFCRGDAQYAEQLKNDFEDFDFQRDEGEFNDKDRWYAFDSSPKKGISHRSTTEEHTTPTLADG